MSPSDRPRLPRPAAILVIGAWVWLLLVTASLFGAIDYSMEVLFLGGTGFVIGLSWLVGTVGWPGLLLPPRLKWWLSVAPACVLGLILAVTDYGLMLRIAVSESALEDYVASLPDGTTRTPCQVGLFQVEGVTNNQGSVFLYTGDDFLGEHGIAYLPEG